MVSQEPFDDVVEQAERGELSREGWDALEAMVSMAPDADAESVPPRVHRVAAVFVDGLRQNRGDMDADMVRRGNRFFERVAPLAVEEHVGFLSLALERADAEPWVLEKLTLAHAVAGRLDALLDVYDRVLERDEALVPRARVLREAIQFARDGEGQWPRVERYARALLDEDPEDDGMWALLVDALKAQGKRDEFPAVERKRPGVLRRLADRYRQAGQGGRAFDYYAELLVLNPGAADVVAPLRRLCQELSPEALSGVQPTQRFAEVLERAAGGAEEPSVAAHLFLEAANTHRAVGDVDPALRLYRRVVDTLSADGADDRETLVRALRRLDRLYQELHQPKDRLDVLERLSALEPEEADRRAALGQLARMAADLGDLDRAAGFWERRRALSADGQDREALDALVHVYRQRGQWVELAEVLEARIGLGGDPGRVEDDYHALAETCGGPLQDPERALLVWTEALRRFGDDDRALAAVTELYLDAGQVAEAREVLERRLARSQRQVADLSVRFATVEQGAGAPPATVISHLSRALSQVPDHEPAIAALGGLQSEEAAAHAFELELRRKRWGAALEAGERAVQRASGEPGNGLAFDTLVRMAEVELVELREPAQALVTYARALVLRPGAESVFRKVVELARGTGEWSGALDALSVCADSLGHRSPLAREAKGIEGVMAETELGDAKRAYGAHAWMLAGDPCDEVAGEGLLRTGAALGWWRGMAEHAVTAARAHGFGRFMSRGDAPPEFAEALFELLEPRLAPGEQLFWEAPLQWVLTFWFAQGASERACRFLRSFELNHRLPDQTLARWFEAELRLGETWVVDAHGARVRAGLRSWAELEEGLAALDGAAVSQEHWVRAFLTLATLAAQLTPEERSAGERSVLLLLARTWRAKETLDSAATLFHLSGFSPALRAELGQLLAGLFLEQGEFARARYWLSRLMEVAPEREESVGLAERLLRVANLTWVDRVALVERLLGLAGSSDTRRRYRTMLIDLWDEAHRDDPQGRLFEANITDDPRDVVTSERLFAHVSEGIRSREDLVFRLGRRLQDVGETSLAVESWLRLGDVLLAGQDVTDGVMDRAERAYREALGATRVRGGASGASPGTTGGAADEGVLLRLGRLRARQDRWEEAAQWVREVAASGSDPACRWEAAVMFARAAERRGEPEPALSWLSAVVDGDWEPADVKARQGGWDVLLRLFAMAERPQDYAALLERSGLEQRGYETLVDHLRRVLSLGASEPSVQPLLTALTSRVSEGDPGLCMGVADTLVTHDRPEAALSFLHAAQEGGVFRRSTDRAAALARMGTLALRVGRAEAALESARLATQLDPAHPGALRALGEAALALDRGADAERAFQTLRLVAQRHQHTDAQVNGAWAWLGLHRVSEQRGEGLRARQYLEQFRTQVRSSGPGGLRVARRLREEGLTDFCSVALTALLDGAATGSLSPGIEADVRVERALLHMGDDPDGARDEMRRALGIYPEPFDDGRVQRVVQSLGLHGVYRDGLVSSAEGLRGENRAARLMRAAAVTAGPLGDPAGALSLVTPVLGSLLSQSTSGGVGRPGDHLVAWVEALEDGETRERWLCTLLEEASLGPVERARLLGLRALSEARRGDLEAVVNTMASARQAHADGMGSLTVLDRITAGLTEGDPDVLRGVEPVFHLYCEMADGQRQRAHRVKAVVRRHRLLGDQGDPELESALAMAVDEGMGDEVEELCAWLAPGDDGVGAPVVLLRGRAWLLQERDDHQGAVEALIAWSQRVSPVEAVVPLLRAAEILHGTLERPQDALELHERALQLNPRSVELWSSYVTVLGSSESSEAVAGRVRAAFGWVDPPMANRLRLLMAKHFLSREGEEGAALPWLREVLAEDPSDGEAQALLGSLYERLDYHEDYAATLEEAVQRAISARDAEALEVSALRYAEVVQRVDPEAARTVLTRALQYLDTNVRLVNAVLALPAEGHGEENLLLQGPLVALLEEGEAVPLALRLADAWEQRGQQESAVRVLERVLERAPGAQDVIDRLASAYGEMEAWARLCGLCRRAASHAEGDARAAWLLRAADIEEHRRDDAVRAGRLLDEAVEAAPGNLEVVKRWVSLQLVDPGPLDEHGDHSVLQRVRELGRSHPDRAADYRALELDTAESMGAWRSVVRTLEAAREGDGVLSAEERARLITGLEHLVSDGALDAAVRRDALHRMFQVTDAAERPRVHDRVMAWVERDGSDEEVWRWAHSLGLELSRWDTTFLAAEALVGMVDDGERMGWAEALVTAAERLGEPGRAQDGLLTAFALQSGDGESRAHLRDMLVGLYELRDDAQALGRLWDGEAERAEGADVHRFFLRAAQAFLNAGDLQSAVHSAERAAAREPTDVHANLLWVDALVGLDRRERAGEILERAIEAHPHKRSKELCQMQLRMARLAADAGDGVVQIQWLKAALESDRTQLDLAADLVDAAMAAGDHDSATQALGIITLSKESGRMSRGHAFLMKARIALGRGETRRALLWARKAREVEPTLDEARAFLEQLK